MEGGNGNDEVFKGAPIRESSRIGVSCCVINLRFYMNSPLEGVIAFDTVT